MKRGATGWTTFCLMLGFYLAPAAGAVTAGDTTTVQLDWTEIFDRVSPSPKDGIRTRKQATLSLSAGNQIAEAQSSVSGKYNASSSRTDTLGGRWRVGQGNSLVKRQDYPHHTRTMTVRVEGRSCSLTVTHNLKVGFSDYVHPMLSRPGQNGIYSRIATVSASCSIN